MYLKVKQVCDLEELVSWFRIRICLVVRILFQEYGVKREKFERNWNSMRPSGVFLYIICGRVSSIFRISIRFFWPGKNVGEWELMVVGS